MNFERVNALLVLAYAVFAMLCAMVSFEPVLASIVFMASISLGFLLSGWRKAFGRLSWQLPVIIAFALFNSVFAGRGSTVLFPLFSFEMYFESLIYGLCIGMMMVSVMKYAILLSGIVSSDEALTVFAGRMPVLSLVTSMSLRLVPGFRKRSRELDDIRRACTCVSKAASKNRRHLHFSNHLTHLLSMSLEDSLICADSMRTRGWGALEKRTVYKRNQLGEFEKMMLTAILLLGIAALILGCLTSAAFSFYPSIAFSESGMFAQFGLDVPVGIPGMLSLFLPYIVYLAFFFLPHLYVFGELIRWRH